MTVVAVQTPVSTKTVEVQLQQALDRVPTNEGLMELRDAALSRPRPDADEKRREAVEKLIRRLITLVGRLFGVQEAGGYTEQERDRALQAELVRRIDLQLQQRALRQAQAFKAIEVPVPVRGPAAAAELQAVDHRLPAEVAAQRRAARLAEAALTADQQATAPASLKVVKTFDARPAPVAADVADMAEEELQRHQVPRG